MPDATLDATGLKCPMPVLRARRALKSLCGGQVLEVLADDQAAATDFPAFCETTGDDLEETSEADGVLRFLIRKKSR